MADPKEWNAAMVIESSICFGCGDFEDDKIEHTSCVHDGRGSCQLQKVFLQTCYGLFVSEWLLRPVELRCYLTDSLQS